MISRFFRPLVLVIAWVAFWRDVSPANIVSGVLVAALVVWLFPPNSDAPALAVRPVPLLKFVGTSLIAIVRANLYVAWEVVTPNDRVNEGVVAVELESNHPVVITLVSHAIILAPGTMVIDIDLGDEDTATKLYVHVLHLRSVDQIRQEVLQLEALALAAVFDAGNARAASSNDGGDQ